MKPSANSYKKIFQKVQEVIQKTEQNIVQTVNRQKVEMCWEIGQIIDQHLLENNRADYGQNFFKELTKDTKIAEKTLYQMRAFYKAYPKLPKDENGLTWSHYRNLVSVKDVEKRKYLEDLTLTQNLDSKELQQKIKKSKPKAKPVKTPTKLVFQRGKIFSYKLAKFSDSDSSFVDCGFGIFTEVETKLTGEGEIVESIKKGAGFSLKKSARNIHQLYTYKAFLDKVVDGDTIHVTLDLGFKIRHKEILRLAKINAAESLSLEGKKATEVLKRILKDVPFLVVKTNKTDIYGRYIADVFFDASGKEKDAQKIADEGVYLSQLLLDRGLVESYAT